jgi:hypothetical protein
MTWYQKLSPRVRLTLGFLLGLAAYALIGCSDATGPTDPTYHPQFQKVYQGAGGGGHGGGGGGGAAGFTSDERALCTLAGTNNDIECSRLLLRLMTGGLGGASSCLAEQWGVCGATYGWAVGALQDWKQQPDPFYQPWFDHDVWPPGVGGTYPVPIGGY